MDKLKVCINLFAIWVFICPLMSFSQEEDLQELKNMKEDIQINNLLNSLDLRKEQMEFIIEKAKEAETIRNAVLERIEGLKPKMVEALQEIKQEIEAGRVTVEEEEAKGFRSSKHQINGVISDTQARIDEIAKEIETKLEQYQLLALDGYKPCIIPRASENRIGQADLTGGVTEILERVKLMPESKYIQNKDKFINQLLKRIKAKIPYGLQIDEQNARIEILNTFQKVRNMEDVDFQLQKQTLAEELRDTILPEKIPLSRINKIKKFLLVENIIPILEERLSKITE